VNNDFEDSVYELMNSEHLSAFSVVERFCDECTKLTPHHIDESKLEKLENLEKRAENEEAFIAPMSVLECVFCRENEESWLGDFN